MARLLFITFTGALLIGLLPISNQMWSMPTMHLDPAAPHTNVVQAKAGGPSPSSCCEAITPCMLTYDVMASPAACFPKYGDSQRLPYAVPINEPIYIKALAPPPKS